LFLNELILSGVERIGSKSAQKLVENIKKAAFKPLFRVISALGIPNVGIVISESIAKAFNQSFDSFLNSDEESLIKIEGIQKTVAGSILSYLKDEENITFLNALKDWWKGPSETIGTITVNNDFFIEEIIKKNGGSVKSSVTAKTDYLVIGSNEPETYNSSKKTKALEHKVDIIDEHKILLMSEQ
jgi:DNA ligase (NAD+)